MPFKEHKHIEEIKVNVTGKKPDEETVKMLKELLEWAENGDVQSVMIIGKRSNGIFFSAYSDSLTIKDTVYGLYLLDSRIKEWLTFSNIE